MNHKQTFELERSSTLEIQGLEELSDRTRITEFDQKHKRLPHRRERRRRWIQYGRRNQWERVVDQEKNPYAKYEIM